MIRLNLGANTLSIPRQDLPNPLPAAIALQLSNASTKREAWCLVADAGALQDWVELNFEIILAAADPLASQIAMREADKGDWVLALYGGAAYSESPLLLTKMRTERCAY